MGIAAHLSTAFADEKGLAIDSAIELKPPKKLPLFFFFSLWRNSIRSRHFSSTSKHRMCSSSFSACWSLRRVISCSRRRNSSSFRRSSSSCCFSSSIMSVMAFTWPFTSCTFRSGLATSRGCKRSSEKESRSLGIWYLMNSCIKSCVSLISFVRLSSARFRTRSSCGLICTTSTPNKVDSSCIARKAFAKACCSGERDSMASLNSFGDGIVDRFKGMVSSSLFWIMAAYFGSKLVADETRPIRTSIELNCLARATNDSSQPDCPENWCESQAWRCLSPAKVTFVDALSGKVMGADSAVLATMVTMGLLMLESPPDPTTASSILTVPSGLCVSERRTEKQRGFGRNAS
mmetsp:Transcript_56950/g.135773  ORF Transcript_56950/g.135773 Transcript_56950/m.135773 type:complete len:347 (+) Transcript_56950:765-1805(+)